MRIPWISRAHHNEVLQVKQDLIDHLKGQIRTLEARLAEPITANVKVTLPDDLTMIQPALMRRTLRPKTESEDAPRPDVNWEEVDENNLVKLAEIASAELPSNASPYVVHQTVARIRRNIRIAKVEKVRRMVTTGSVGTVASSTPPAPPVVASPVPESILKRIEAAEKGE